MFDLLREVPFHQVAHAWICGSENRLGQELVSQEGIDVLDAANQRSPKPEGRETVHHPEDPAVDHALEPAVCVALRIQIVPVALVRHAVLRFLTDEILAATQQRFVTHMRQACIERADVERLVGRHQDGVSIQQRRYEFVPRQPVPGNVPGQPRGEAAWRDALVHVDASLRVPSVLQWSASSPIARTATLWLCLTTRRTATVRKRRSRPGPASGRATGCHPRSSSHRLPNSPPPAGPP